MTDKINLIPQKRNANKHTLHGTRLLEKSIQQDGFIDAQTAAADGEIISGSARLELAADKFADVEPIIVHSDGKRPVIVIRDDISNANTARAKRLSVAANQIAKTDFNPDGELLKEWAGEDDAIRKMFADSEWTEITGEEKPTVDAEAQIDRAEELQVKWQTETGQLWQLGKHRLLIGDCTARENVERLMGGERASMCFTSPPYAAQRDYKIGKFNWLDLMTGMSEQAIFACSDNASILVNLGLVHLDGKVFRYWDPWIDWMEENEQPLYGWYVWDKLSGLMGDWRGRLAPAHEWIFHFANKPNRANKTAPTKYAENGVTHYKKNKVGLREKDGNMTGFTMAGEAVNSTKVIDSVIRCQPQRGGIEGHPAPFSVLFASTLISVYSKEKEIVYEPFCGSGTSIIACQELKRISYSLELEPQYGAVILERFATAFPAEEIRLIE